MRRLALFVAMTFLASCAVPARPYAALETEKLDAADAADAAVALDAFRDDALYSIEVDRPFEEVWAVVVRLAAQGLGVLHAARHAAGGDLVFVAKRIQHYAPPAGGAVTGAARALAVGAWVAVEVRAGTRGTRVTVAWLHPRDGQPSPVTVIGASSPTLEADAMLRALGATAIQDYLIAIREQLATGFLLGRLTSSHVPEWRTGGPSLVQSEPAEWAEFAPDIGNVASAEAIGLRYMLDDRALTERLERIARRLLQAAGAPGAPLRVHLYAAEGPQPPFAFANGDLFISTGFLRAMTDVDQVAAALAHEIDHVLSRDGVKRLRRRANALNTTFNLQLLLSGLSVFNVTAMTTPAYGAEQLLEGLGYSSELLAALGGLWQGSAVSTEYVASTYSIDEELRADWNGTIYLWRAGYRASALQEVIGRQ